MKAFEINEGQRENKALYKALMKIYLRLKQTIFDIKSMVKKQIDLERGGSSDYINWPGS